MLLELYGLSLSPNSSIIRVTTALVDANYLKTTSSLLKVSTGTLGLYLESRRAKLPVLVTQIINSISFSTFVTLLIADAARLSSEGAILDVTAL